MTAKKNTKVPSHIIDAIYGDIDLTPLANKLNRRDKDILVRIKGLSKLLDTVLSETTQLREDRSDLEKRIKALEGRMASGTSWRKTMLDFLEDVGLKPKRGWRE